MRRQIVVRVFFAGQSRRWCAKHPDIGEQRSVAAEIVGAFAVHRAVCFQNGWAITHPPTGFTIGWANSRPGARRAASLVTKATGRDVWSFTDPATTLRWPKRRQRAILNLVRAATR